MIPEEFLKRMKDLLGEEYPAFYRALGEEDAHGLRVNRQKTDDKRVLETLGFSPEPLSFVSGGYLVPPGERPGILPQHHAGMYYLQDPSAMATVAAAPVRPGMRVLDLCAAPGGKSTQLSALIGATGILVSNEIVPSRARTLVGNMERLGVRNAVVLHHDPAGIASLFDRYFDFVLVDAPCSGEGMFRKYPEAGTEWSPENVRMCAARQREILEEAVKTVAEGGYLLYSTCTFSREENEENVVAFLSTHPEFVPEPLSPAVEAVTVPGVCAAGEETVLRFCRRYYPHRSPGEGQFMALFRRIAGGRGGCLYRDASLPLSKRDAENIRAALSSLMRDPPDGRLVGENIVALPEGFSLPPRGVFMGGVCLGNQSGSIFTPHHQCFSAYGKEMANRLDMTPDDPRVAAYLRGEEIPAPGVAAGFCAVLLCGAPLGGGKVSNGRLKNRYPKGLRLPPV